MYIITNLKGGNTRSTYWSCCL